MRRCPIFVSLNAYADALGRADQNLEHYLAEHFAGLAQGIAGLAPLFESALGQGRAVILLDGLDEVQRDRAHLVNKVEAFAREAVRRGNKVVVTSRIVGYRDSPLTPQDWALYTLLDFDRAAMDPWTRTTARLLVPLDKVQLDCVASLAHLLTKQPLSLAACFTSTHLLRASSTPLTVRGHLCPPCLLGVQYPPGARLDPTHRGGRQA